MFRSQSKGTDNHDTMRNGQTLFDFLKRKKKVSLQDTINKKSKFQHSKTKSNHQEILPLSSNSKTKRLQNTDDHEYDEGRINITPKKVDFDHHSSNIKSKNEGRSFLNMISPMRRRSSSQIEHHFPKHSSTSKNSENQSDQFTKKNILKSINVIKQTINKLLEAGTGIKQEANRFFIQLNQILSFVDAQRGKENSSLTQSASEVRYKLKHFAKLFDEFDVQDADQVIEDFHKSLSQHILLFETNLRSEIEKSKDKAVNEVREEKNAIVSTLQTQKCRLEKSLQIYERKIDKITREKEAIQNQIEERDKINIEKIENIRKKYESKIETLQSSLKESNEKYKQIQQKEKQFEKKIKDSIFKQQSLQKQSLIEAKQVKEVRQQYLLNQIFILKQQFTNDIKKLNELFQTKEKDYLCVIQQKDRALKALIQQRQYDKDLDQKILTEANISKQECLVLKKKNECLITDMYRLNEQLYQHWLALKDIKTLANRLTIYPSFKRIFDDLAFNQLLFT